MIVIVLVIITSFLLPTDGERMKVQLTSSSQQGNDDTSNDAADYAPTDVPAALLWHGHDRGWCRSGDGARGRAWGGRRAGRRARLSNDGAI